MVVIDNGGRTNVTVWGGILTETAVRRRLGGSVIHGACRDVSTIRALEYPVFSRGVHMRTGKDRVKACQIQVEVALDDVAVRPGDLVLGDADGVVVIPSELRVEVTEAALEIEAAETEIPVR